MAGRTPTRRRGRSTVTRVLSGRRRSRAWRGAPALRGRLFFAAVRVRRRRRAFVRRRRRTARRRRRFPPVRRALLVRSRARSAPGRGALDRGRRPAGRRLGGAGTALRRGRRRFARAMRTCRVRRAVRRVRRGRFGRRPPARRRLLRPRRRRARRPARPELRRAPVPARLCPALAGLGPRGHVLLVLRRGGNGCVGGWLDRRRRVRVRAFRRGRRTRLRRRRERDFGRPCVFEERGLQAGPAHLPCLERVHAVARGARP
jgi:hypothetical protein